MIILVLDATSNNYVGRTYYYNSKTKETTWNKPFELATPAEQQEMLRSKQEAVKFFRDMEENILTKYRAESKTSPRRSFKMDISSGSSSPRNSLNVIFGVDNSSPSSEYSRPRFGSNSGHNSLTRPMRTISTIDDEIIDMLKYDGKSKSVWLIRIVATSLMFICRYHRVGTRVM